MICVFSFFACEEENREVCPATQLGGAHQPGGLDSFRIRAEQSQLATQRQMQHGAGVLLPYPVKTPTPSLLLQWRSGKHQKNLRVPHQLHKEMGRQVRCHHFLF